MGLTSSKNAGDDTLVIDEAFIGAYDAALESEASRTRTGGGCGCEAKKFGMGDLADVSEYVDSVNSKSKTRIIESILEAAGKLGLKSEGSTPAARIKSLIAAIPAGDRFKRDDKVQAGVCKSIASAINSAYGVKVMETELPADALCQHIAEILSSLGAGVHTEFLAVYNDVQKVLHNLNLLQEQLTADMAQIKEKISRCEDGATAKNLQLNFDLYDMLVGEVKRQVQMLSNLLNVHLVPSASDLSKLLKDKKEIHGWIKKIDLKPGSDKFGRVISDLLRGLGVTANFMLVIEDALKTVGVTLSQYREMKNLDQLRNAVVSKAVSLDGEALHKFNDALELLEKNLSKVKYTPVVGSYSGTEEMRGGGLTVGAADKPQDNIAQTASDSDSASATGGASGPYARSTMDKRVDDRKKLRNLIYETFVRQLNGVLDKFIGAIDVLSMKIGTEIPISDQLDGFRQAINRINSSMDLARKRMIYLALIGYYNDAMSKSKRDQVVGEMKMVSSFIDSIVELPAYRASAGYFQAVQAQIKALLDLIGKYTEEIAAKFGRGEPSEEESQERGMDRTGAYASAVGEVMGSAASAIGALPVTLGGYGTASAVGEVMRGAGAGTDSPYATGRGAGIDDPHAVGRGAGTDAPYADGAAASLIDTVGGASGILATDPNYLYAGGEEMYGGYDDSAYGGADVDVPAPKFRATKTLDDAVRQFDYKFRVAQIRSNLARSGAELSHYGEKYEKITANSLADVLREEQKKYIALAKTLEAEIKVAGGGAVGDELAQAKKFLDGQWESKKKFWATVEALDGYMRAFTNGIVNHPNDIKDIRAVLDDIEVIRDWYSEASGNQLASVFDHFPSRISVVANGAAPTPGEEYLNLDGSTHYYQAVEKGIAAGNNPGVPYNVTEPKKGVEARNTLKGMLSSMTALKNLLSVFVHFGSKFGGNDLNKVTFLTPAQIYNNLLDYLQASAFQQGFGINDLSTDAQGLINGANWSATANPALTTLPPTVSVGASGVSNAANLDANGLRRRHWGVWMRSTQSSLKNAHGTFTFDKEDDYFVILMKAIGAKILTVTGMYDVLDRPHEFNGISPIRMIMGGDSETPKVEEGAVALYLRLPLLCQFWRVIFNFNEQTPPEGENRFTGFTNIRLNGNQALKISMIPDVEGTFSGLIRLIFRKHKYLDTSAYSDDDIKDIIRECNMIYQKMSAKHPQNTVMETIYELIAEVNRRYGIITKEDRDTFETEFGPRYDYGIGNKLNADGTYTDRYSRDPDPSDIALLPGEDEEAIPRPSGAERLLEGTDFNQTSTKLSKYNVDLQHRDLLYRFRCVIDKFFENPREEYSFNGAIKSTQQKLKRETRDEERFKIVASLVRGVDVYSKVDGLKYLFFHETVVAGLNVLSGLHSMLARFQARAQLMNLNRLVDLTTAYIAGNGAVPADGATAAVAAGTALNSGNLRTYIKVADPQLLDTIGNGNVGNLLSSILGESEANQCYSGRGGTDWTIRPTHDMQVPEVARFNGQTVPGGVVNGANDLAGVLNGLRADQLKDLFYQRESTADQNKVFCFFRYLVNREFVMKELLESLFGLSSDLQGLVEVRVDDGKLYMNAGGLKSLINELFDQVGYFMELMRPHIRNDVINKYTSKLHAGSLYWLQEQLLEKILVGRPAQAVATPGQPARPAYANLDEQMRGLSDMYHFLTREFKFSGAGLRAGAASTVNSVASRNSFDKVFASLIFYDAELNGSGLLPSNDASGWNAFTADSAPKVVKFRTDPYEALHLAGPAGAQVLDTRFAARFYQLYSWKDELTLNRSALFVFNQLVAKFIQSFYDPGQKKMYKGLIDQFANGTFNRAINDHRYTYPDVAPAVISKHSGPEDLKAPPVIVSMAPLGPEAIQARADLIDYINALPAPGVITEAGIRAEANRLRNGVPARSDLNDALRFVDAFDPNTIRRVVEVYPYSTNTIGSSNREKKSRVEMFADMLFAVMDSVANGTALDTAVTNAAKSLSSRNVYSTGRTSAFTYLIKADEMSGVSDANIAAASIPGPAYEEKLLMFARDAAIDNGAAAGSIDELGISEPPAGPARAPPAKSVAALTQFGRRADPDGDHVLFTSLAVVIRNLVHTRNLNQQQTLVYMNENANDIPIYMKEKMRANLPAFKNLFRELINRCEFLKKFMMRREMNIDRHWVAAGINGSQGLPSHNPWPWGLALPVAGESDRAKDRFSSILDTIVRGSQTLITACDTTLKEIGDDPKYLETYQGSIRDYRAQYGVDPIMPVSSLLSVLKNVDSTNELDFFPIHSLGELHFKLMYGGRSLLQNMASQPTAESVPGWTQTVESFNLMVDTRLQADRGHTDGFLKALTKGIRYLYDLKRVKGLLTPHLHLDCVGAEWATGGAARDAVYSSGALTRADLIQQPTAQITNRSATSIVSADVDGYRHLKPVFALREPLTRVVMLTESSNRDDQLKNLVEYICGSDKKDRRNTLAVQNIIDLNIIPINVHALMRDIPLANLYNYAYTYDRAMIDLYYGAGGEGANDLIRDLCNGSGDINGKINSPKDVMVAMLLNPYLNIDDDKLNNVDSRRRAEYVQGMLLGSTGEEGLGRPKFLSDQVYNKVIFGELYTSWDEMSDMGPEVRYPRTLTRDVVQDQLADAIADVVNMACAAGGKFATQAIPVAVATANALASMFLDDQTASVKSLAAKVSKLRLAGLNRTADENENYCNAVAIILATVGPAFLWALNSSIADSANVATYATVADSIIRSLPTLTFARGKLETSAMAASPIDNRARKVFAHIVKTLGEASFTSSPLSGGMNVLDAGSAGPLGTAVTDHRGTVGNVANPLQHSRQNTNGDARSLHYLQNGELKTAAVGRMPPLAANGKMRFDTVIVRNLVFVVNLYRSVRLRLQRDLTYSKDIITRSIPITREQLTEFSGNKSLTGRSERQEYRYE